MATVLTGVENSTDTEKHVNLDWDPLPSYATIAKDLFNFYNQTMQRCQARSYSFPRDISQDFEVLFNFSRDDVVLAAALVVGFTVLRSFFSKYLLTPVGRYLELTPESAEKLPESVWKLLYYGLVWVYTYRVIVQSGQYRFFQNPSTVWDGYSTVAEIPTDIYWLYAIQGAFYVHGLYALFFQDAWRKDSPVMAVHHVVTIALIWFSYTTRCHNIGALVMLFHDCCDVELEFAKINVYLKVRGGRTFKFHDILAAISFLAMTGTWFIARLYYFPLKVLWACSSVLISRGLFPEYALLVVSMLLLLTAMNIFWFSQMIMFLYKILSGELSEVDDIREYDVVEKLERTSEKISKEKKVD